jgi:hypothetical protein
MMKYVLPIAALALLWGIPLPGPKAANASEALCGGNAGCETCGHHCPHCGCALVPVCHCQCDVKKTVTYKYDFVCKDICIPGPGCCCDKCNHCESGQCAAGCDTCYAGCNKNFGCGCSVYTSKRLIKYPVVKETPVRICTVEWTCPNCGNCGQCEPPPASGAAPVGPGPVAPAPLPPTKSADVAPLPADLVSFTSR